LLRLNVVCGADEVCPVGYSRHHRELGFDMVRHIGLISCDPLTVYGSLTMAITFGALLAHHTLNLAMIAIVSQILYMTYGLILILIDFFRRLPSQASRSA
jgi:hypothetical protein